MKDGHPKKYSRRDFSLFIAATGLAMFGCSKEQSSKISPAVNADFQQRVIARFDNIPPTQATFNDNEFADSHRAWIIQSTLKGKYEKGIELWIHKKIDVSDGERIVLWITNRDDTPMNGYEIGAGLNTTVESEKETSHLKTTITLSTSEDIDLKREGFKLYIAKTKGYEPDATINPIAVIVNNPQQ